MAVGGLDQPSDQPFFTLHDETSNANAAAPSDPRRARLGRIAVKGRRTLDTPNFLALTSRGVVPHVSPDVVEEQTEFAGIYMAIEDWADQDVDVEKASRGGVPPIMRMPARNSTPLHSFTALPPSLITVLSPRRSPAVSSPQGNPDSGLSIFTSTGFQSLSTQRYAEYANYIKPDITIGLGDLPYGPMPGRKRASKMSERTTMWVDSFLSQLSKSPGSKGAPETALFAPILTRDYQSQFEYIEHISEDLAPSLSGLAFYCSSLLPDIPQTASLNRLVRLSLDEPSSPHEILRQVSLGMDVFTIPYLSFATDSGLALTYEFPRPSTPDSSNPSVEGTSLLPLAIDLFSSDYSTAVTPLIPSCTCYACTSHHRAYIQHLLHAKEMLAWTLLALHNHHATSTFFAAVRKSIAAGTFEADKEVFERIYETELPEATGHKPRARGYHFKSGAAEPKRNKPAWGALSEGVGATTQTPPVMPDDDAETLDKKGFAEDLADRPE
ncbi:hypothetical protein V494_02606 [Pseudogymnoascus sp. VKM F-4513 (FW-928)]|nr:hypothetical protein V494_02606 [Pseudogymnoascus sp. VKM F-4513 (FW-928)]